MTEQELRDFIQRQDAELKASIQKPTQELAARLMQLEQHIASGGGGTGRASSFSSGEDVGQTLVNSEGFKAFTRGANSSGRISVESFHKTAIINATGQNQPLVPDYRMPGIVSPGMFPLSVRDALPQFRTTSNLIQYTQESSFTNAAAMQAGENVAKAESAMAFVLKNAAVQTLAHWIPLSRQVLDDSVALADYVNMRLMFGLKSVEEGQLLNGNGTGQNLSGLIMNATPFAGGSSGTLIDMIGSALAQVESRGFKPDRIILHPQDFWQMSLIRTSYGEYVYSNPLVSTPAQLWSVPVITSINMQRGEFLCGAFPQAAAIWDRWDATIEVSREHQDYFIKNMVAVLCEERLALTVFQPSALTVGMFTVSS